MKKMNVGIIGCQFMGKAHSNAWKKAPLFFDLNIQPILKVACGRHEEPLKAFADRWGWEDIETDWKKVVERDDIDIIDIAVPTYLHHEIAIAAANAGKHIFCETPAAVDYKRARQMYKAVKDTPVKHFLNHSHRRCPAIMLAKQLIEEGRLGRIFHWRGAYMQDWSVDPDVPLTWRMKKEYAGAGAHNALNSHNVDLAMYLIGDIKSVSCTTSTFITERPLAEEELEQTAAETQDVNKKAEVTVDDAAFMIVEFENGALGSFQASRFGTGRKNSNCFEIHGSKGSLAFDFERMNELQYFSSDDLLYAQGFRTILATEDVHPYIANWWPPGHGIGFEHEFVHGVVDFLNAIDKDTTVEPNFHDGMECMRVLDAALQSAESGKRVVIK